MLYLRAASVALLCAAIGTRSADAIDDNIDGDAIVFSPLDVETCRQVGEASATVLSYVSPINGQAWLKVNWGDGTKDTYSGDVNKGGQSIIGGKANGPYYHAYAAVGLYKIKAVAIVMDEDNKMMKENFVATIQVRSDCHDSGNGNRGVENAENDGGGIEEDGLTLAGGDEGTITGEWSFFDFGPMDTNLCRSAGEQSTALSLMSIFSGELTMDVSMAWFDFASLTNMAQALFLTFLSFSLLISLCKYYSWAKHRFNGETINSTSILSVSPPESPTVLITPTSKPGHMISGPPPNFAVSTPSAIPFP